MTGALPDIRERSTVVTPGEIECCARCLFLARKHALTPIELRVVHYVFRAQHLDGSLGEDP